MAFFNTNKLNNEVFGFLSMLGTDLNLVFDGDSLTQGVGGTNSQDYPNYINNKLSPLFNSLTFNSFGVSGQAPLEMEADAATQIDVLIDNSKYNLLVAWEDVNAILNDERTGQQNFDDFTTYFANRKTAGWDYCVLVLGYYPRLKLDDTYNQPTWNDTLFDEQEAYRQLVRQAVNTQWDVFVDLTTQPEVGGDRGKYINSFFDDSVHLTVAGYDAVGEWILHNGILKPFKI